MPTKKWIWITAHYKCATLNFLSIDLDLNTGYQVKLDVELSLQQTVTPAAL